ncbi:hypothetical protein [Streptomyces eurocidicus]|uniref:Uncharacterized protein n=1 Tax=Streptomyces eurocidicus TaxID=66423 RepID=A0A7W8BBD6_STREU|nr:hypothetical protein [Streptomyces eurocidicus]MBB5118439.1 hypothetical protein [Streptomyces eurocidicus]MBF6051891.1 hypothetical protein [Streptomyces eurocidicus]
MTEHQVGPEEFVTPGRDAARARMLHTSLRALARGGAGPVLQEMAEEVLGGRMGLRECLRTNAYAEALGRAATAAHAEWERMPAAEREHHEAEARRLLATPPEPDGPGLR